MTIGQAVGLFAICVIFTLGVMTGIARAGGRRLRDRLTGQASRTTSSESPLEWQLAAARVEGERVGHARGLAEGYRSGREAGFPPVPICRRRYFARPLPSVIPIATRRSDRWRRTA